MRVLLIVGDNLRHKYFANKVIEKFNVVGVIGVRRDYDREKKVAGDIKLEYSGDDAVLMHRHFSLREEKEEEYFGEHSRFFLSKIEKLLEVDPDNLNEQKYVEFVREVKADVVLVYGTPLIKKNLLSVCPKYTINCHAGLSPWYKGAATLFWPIYFMEAEKAGVTFHLINSKIDNGDIIHQCRPRIFANDTIHDIGCRAIVVAADHIVKLLEKLRDVGGLDSHPQKEGGKIFSKRDFRPYHLRVIKWMLENNYFEEYLADMDSPQRQVRLIEQPRINFIREG